MQPRDPGRINHRDPLHELHQQHAGTLRGRRAPAYGPGGWGFESLAARTKTAAQQPCDRDAGTVGQPDCDQTATTSAGSPEATSTTCDHNRLSMGRFSWTTAAAGPIPGSRRLWHSASSPLGSLGEPYGGLRYQAVPARWAPGDLTSTLRMRGAYPWLQWLSHRCWLCPLRGSGADGPSDALRVIDLTACPRSWRTCGPRRLRRKSAPGPS
jgi:hypothetical protein